MERILDLDTPGEGDTVAVFPSMDAARSYLEQTVEWALSLLDQIAGDTDIEGQHGSVPNKGYGSLDPDLDDDATAELEPSYGSVGGTAAYGGGERMSQEGWSAGAIVSPFSGDEAEDDDPAEPSLGSLDRQPQDVSYRQSFAALGEPDLEGDERGREPDLESSLGWSSTGAIGSNDDREDENEHGGDIQDEPHDGELDLAEGCDLGGTDNGIGDQGGLDEQSGGTLGFDTSEENRRAAREVRDHVEELGRRKGKHVRRRDGICNVEIIQDGTWYRLLPVR